MSPVVQETGRAVSCYGERLLKSYFPSIRQQTTSWETYSIVLGVSTVFRSCFLNSSLKLSDAINIFSLNIFRLDLLNIVGVKKCLKETF